MAAPVLPNPDALAALAAPPVIPPAPAQPAPAVVGGVAQAAQAAPDQQEEVCCTTCSFRFRSLALVCRLLASRFLFILL